MQKTTFGAGTLVPYTLVYSKILTANGGASFVWMWLIIADLDFPLQTGEILI